MSDTGNIINRIEVEQAKQSVPQTPITGRVIRDNIVPQQQDLPLPQTLDTSGITGPIADTTYNSSVPELGPTDIQQRVFQESQDTINPFVPSGFEQIEYPNELLYDTRKDDWSRIVSKYYDFWKSNNNNQEQSKTPVLDQMLQRVRAGENPFQSTLGRPFDNPYNQFIRQGARTWWQGLLNPSGDGKSFYEVKLGPLNLAFRNAGVFNNMLYYASLPFNAAFGLASDIGRQYAGFTEGFRNGYNPFQKSFWDTREEILKSSTNYNVTDSHKDPFQFVKQAVLGIPTNPLAFEYDESGNFNPLGPVRIPKIISPIQLFDPNSYKPSNTVALGLEGSAADYTDTKTAEELKSSGRQIKIFDTARKFGDSITGPLQYTPFGVGSKVAGYFADRVDEIFANPSLFLRTLAPAATEVLLSPLDSPIFDVVKAGFRKFGDDLIENIDPTLTEAPSLPGAKTQLQFEATSSFTKKQQTIDAIYQGLYKPKDPLKTVDEIVFGDIREYLDNQTGKFNPLGYPLVSQKTVTPLTIVEDIQSGLPIQYSPIKLRNLPDVVGSVLDQPFDDEYLNRLFIEELAKFFREQAPKRQYQYIDELSLLSGSKQNTIYLPAPKNFVDNFSITYNNLLSETTQRVDNFVSSTRAIPQYSSTTNQIYKDLEVLNSGVSQNVIQIGNTRQLLYNALEERLGLSSNSGQTYKSVIERSLIESRKLQDSLKVMNTAEDTVNSALAIRDQINQDNVFTIPEIRIRESAKRFGIKLPENNKSPKELLDYFQTTLSDIESRLGSMNSRQLKEIGKNLQIPKWSRQKKDELKESIRAEIQNWKTDVSPPVIDVPAQTVSDAIVESPTLSLPEEETNDVLQALVEEYNQAYRAGRPTGEIAGQILSTMAEDYRQLLNDVSDDVVQQFDQISKDFDQAKEQIRQEIAQDFAENAAKLREEIDQFADDLDIDPCLDSAIDIDVEVQRLIDEGRFLEAEELFNRFNTND